MATIRTRKPKPKYTRVRSWLPAKPCEEIRRLARENGVSFERQASMLINQWMALR